MQRYIEALNAFTTTHQIPRDLASRIRKANEELGELSETIINGNVYEIEAEACDLCNVAFDILQVLTNDPLAALLRNLEVKDAKYREGMQRIEARK